MIEITLSKLTGFQAAAAAGLNSYAGGGKTTARLVGTTHEAIVAEAVEAAAKAKQARSEAGHPAAAPAHDCIVAKLRKATPAEVPDAVAAPGPKAQAPKAKAKGQVLRYFRNGTPMANSENQLSAVAAFYTKGIAEGRSRITTAELTEILVAAGVADPKGDEFEATLPNGVVVAARWEPAGTVHARPRRAADGKAKAADRIAGYRDAKAAHAAKLAS